MLLGENIELYVHKNPPNILEAKHNIVERDCSKMFLRNSGYNLNVKGHMKRYFVISLNMVILHIKYVFEYLTTDSS